MYVQAKYAHISIIKHNVIDLRGSKPQQLIIVNTIYIGHTTLTMQTAAYLSNNTAAYRFLFTKQGNTLDANLCLLLITD